MASEVTPPPKTPAEYLADVTPKQLAELNEGKTLDRVLLELIEAHEDAYRGRAAHS